MHSSILPLAPVFAALAAAAPTFNLVTRGCSIFYPSTIVRLDQSVPNYPSGQTSEIRILQNAGGNGATDSEIQFTSIPTNAYGCQLEVVFAPGTLVQNSGSSRVNVWAVDRDVSIADTWNNAPGKSFLFGTADILSSPTEQKKIVINSLVCQPTLNFRFEIASETDFGSVRFTQTSAEGVRLTHSC